MNKEETLELVRQKLFFAVEKRKNPKYLELYLNDACAFISYETDIRLLCIEFLIRIGDTERAEKHILDTDSSECKDELIILHSMLMSKQGNRREGRILLNKIDPDGLTENSLRLYASAFEEYGEFEKAFETLKDNISNYENDEFLLRMLIRLYNEKIIKAELFNECEKAEELKIEKSSYSMQLEKLGVNIDEE